mmetsp:Transcript_15/g.53  ORF Transcript_15/g.53 Transcript_15/m.53 type:complete len:237 (-) Transcript_15:289-999(-)
MNVGEVHTTGAQRFWDEQDAAEKSKLQDCSEHSRLAATQGALPDVTEQTRRATTGRFYNEHLFLRSTAEVKRRMEIAREGGSAEISWDQLGRDYTAREIARELDEERHKAEEEHRLADMTYATRVAVTGRSFPDGVMYRTTKEAKMRIDAARRRAKAGSGAGSGQGSAAAKSAAESPAAAQAAQTESSDINTPAPCRESGLSLEACSRHEDERNGSNPRHDSNSDADDDVDEHEVL